MGGFRIAPWSLAGGGTEGTSVFLDRGSQMMREIQAYVISV